jgi:hypothetical protein
MREIIPRTDPRSDYQLTMITHPSVSDGAGTEALSEMVRDVAPVRFGENKPDTP